MSNLTNIFYKIKKLFKNFYKKNTNLTLPETKTVKENKHPESLTSSLQRDFKEYSTKSNIIELINKHPHLLYELSTQRLQQLNQIYDEKISEMTIKINELKTKKTF